MLQRILVFFLWFVFEMLFQAGKCTSDLILAFTTFENNISFEPFEYKDKVHQTQEIRDSFHQDRKRQTFIFNNLIIIAACVAVFGIQIVALEVQKCRKPHDDVYITRSKDRSISELSFLREFAYIPEQKCWALPFSLGDYLNKSEKGNTKEYMNYEWGRYESFKNFPMECPVTPMRLSSNGFYYTGTKDIVECFSCKLEYGGWKEGDKPDALHKLLSPECDFINSTNSTNIPIHPTSESISNASECHLEGAIGGASYETESNAKSCNSNIHVQHQSRQSQITNDEITSRRITHKFPDYENSQHRIDSFNDWSSANVIASRALVEAGFFYAGFSDCVRCFSCGGGLRNWEYGDGPWEEHARWFPSCKFLIEQKGQAFVTQYQETLTDADHDQLPTEAIVSGEEALRTLEGDSKHHEADGNVIIENEDERKITCDVKKMLNEMGFLYSFHLIMQVVHRLKQNGDRISTELVINHLIDNSEYFENHEEGEGTNISEQEPVNDVCRNKAAGNKTENKSSRDISSKLLDTSTSADPDTLQEENAKLKSQLLCKICMDSDSDVVFIPCGHMVSCEKCAPHIRKCAVCRVPIKGRVKAFMS